LTGLFQEQERQRKLDKLNRQKSFDPKIQFYPADLFILKAFDLKGLPIWERNPRWHDEDGFFIGRSEK
jgi:hypothetical protein